MRLIFTNYIQFLGQFQQAAASGRGSYINTLRQALPMILAMPHDLFTLGNSDRHKDPALQALVQRDPDSTSYPTYPPIFFPKEADSQMSKLFQSVTLMKVSYHFISNNSFRLILWVVSSGSTSHSFRSKFPHKPGLCKA